MGSGPEPGDAICLRAIWVGRNGPIFFLSTPMHPQGHASPVKKRPRGARHPSRGALLARLSGPPSASCLFETQIAHCTANRACPRLRPIPPLVRGERGDQGLSSDARAPFARASCAELACSERSLFGQALKAVPAFRRRSSVTRPLALLVNEERTRRISSRSSLCAAPGLLRARATSNALRRKPRSADEMKRERQ